MQISTKDIIKPENLVYTKTKLLTDTPLSYCPGCGHGTANRIVMEVLDEMGVQDKTIGIAPVGCSVLAYNFMNVDMIQAAHGRAPAVATAVKRVFPDFDPAKDRMKIGIEKDIYLAIYHLCLH